MMYNIVLNLIASILIVNCVSATTIQRQDCKNEVGKCTSKDHRSTIYTRCMMLRSDQSLWCDQSNLTSIPNPRKVYDNRNLRNASALYINDSCLTELKRDELKEYPEIKCFKCGRNFISRLQENLFSANTKLERLDFCRNRVKRIEGGTFRGLAKLKALDLANNKIDEIKASMFVGLESLEELSFHNNEIALLNSKSFHGLRHLNVLILTGNKIGHIDEDAFVGLENLTHLHLDGNRLHELSSRVFASLCMLEVLTISYNGFTMWPEFSQGAFSSLHTLNIAHNMLEEFTTGSMANLSKLQNLSLENNSLQRLPEDLFLQTPSLRYLNVSDNDIEEIGKYTFSKLCHLEMLSLRRNFLKIAHPEWFSQIVKNGEMEGNDLSFNRWDCDCDMVPYGKFLSSITTEWSKVLQVNCNSPKTLEGSLLNDATVDHITTRKNCGNATKWSYDTAMKSCNDTSVVFIRHTTVYTYTTAPKEATSDNSKIEAQIQHNTTSEDPATVPSQKGFNTTQTAVVVTLASLVLLIAFGAVFYFVKVRYAANKEKSPQEDIDEKTSLNSNRIEGSEERNLGFRDSGESESIFLDGQNESQDVEAQTTPRASPILGAPSEVSFESMNRSYGNSKPSAQETTVPKDFFTQNQSHDIPHPTEQNARSDPDGGNC